MIALWYAGFYVLVTGLTMQAHLVHLLCQFMVLVDCFENLLEDCSANFIGINECDLIHNKEFAENITKRLGNLVKQHQFILSLTRDLKAVLSVPMLAQLAVTGSLVCVAGYQGATTFDQGVVKALMSIIFLVYNIFELYIVCRWCEEITTLSSKLGEAIYCSGWERGVSQIRGVRPTILIVMARAHKPLYFTAGGMYNLTVDSFARCRMFTNMMCTDDLIKIAVIKGPKALTLSGLNMADDVKSDDRNFLQRIANKSFYNKLAISMDSPYFDTSTEKRKKLVKAWAQTNETYLKLLLFLGNSTLITWFIYPLLDDVEYNLIIDVHVPFYYKTPKLYPIVYIMVVIALWYCAYFVMVTALTTQAHLIHLLCQFSVLTDCFENVLNDCSKDFAVGQRIIQHSNSPVTISSYLDLRRLHIAAEQ
ncbi:unnamed protein product [Arctia plantaginis]|uniref:Odorant receptor n=1 Tax=Arctia plantaginis TaxID=874455 RepID=A0A8S1A3K4_ARCPL|nr:unnamed protein product [Arctia plantaginis]